MREISDLELWVWSGTCAELLRLGVILLSKQLEEGLVRRSDPYEVVEVLLATHQSDFSEILAYLRLEELEHFSGIVRHVLDVRQHLHLL